MVNMAAHFGIVYLSIYSGLGLLRNKLITIIGQNLEGEFHVLTINALK